MEDHLDKGHNLHKNRWYIEPQLLCVHDSKTSACYIARKPEMKYISKMAV
jgi:hypothetical protein